MKRHIDLYILYYSNDVNVIIINNSTCESTSKYTYMLFILDKLSSPASPNVVKWLPFNILKAKI